MMATNAYTFKLAWRWTQPSHNVLPTEVMDQIVPLESVAVPDDLVMRGKLDRSAVKEDRSTRTDLSSSQVNAWLAKLPILPTQDIIVRWDEFTAVRTNWRVFSRFWDDFCYPSSDDVAVFPEAGDWILLYHHEEQFEWAQRKRP